MSEDFSARAVSDAVVVHESGLHLLLTPVDVRDVEAVSPRALREVLRCCGRSTTSCVVDAGSHVTPAQAAIVELADELVMVTTPDVLALRGLRRAITTWEGLEVRKENDVRVLVNRMSRHDDGLGRHRPAAHPRAGARRRPAGDVPAPWSRRSTAATRCSCARTPGGARSTASGRRSARGAGPVRARHVARGGAAAAAGPATRAGGGAPRRRRGDARRPSALLPAVLLVAVLVWQAVLYGVAFTWSGPRVGRGGAGRLDATGTPRRGPRGRPGRGRGRRVGGRRAATRCGSRSRCR